MVSLKVAPLVALVDEDVVIVAEGLRPHQAVTLVAVLHDKKITMASYAHYEADDHGTVDVTKQESLGGTYEGVEPMGFIWSLQVTGEGRKSGQRLMKRNVREPVEVEVRLHAGHVTADDTTSDACLASQHAERRYVSDDVERVDVREGRLMATMFIPKGEGPYPGVLDLFGSIGGLVEYRASLLASRGFVTMAVAYYWPGKEIISDLEYYEQAIELLWRHPKVLKTGLGTIGVSKGGEVVTLMSVISPKVRAVVSIGGPPTAVIVPATFRGETFPSVDLSYFARTDEGMVERLDEDIQEKLDKGEDINIIPIERSRAKFLLIHGTDDHSTPGVAAQLLPARLAEVGRADDCRVIMYQDAGHLIEPPHSPHFRVSYHKLFNDMFLWGGRPKMHARAQEDSWRQIQHFIRSTLTSLPLQPPSRL